MGPYWFRVRSEDLAPSYARLVHNALEDFVSKKNLRVGNGKNGVTTFCPRGFYLPFQGQCNCDGRHIDASPWNEAECKREIKHLSGRRQSSTMNISGRANSDILHRR
mmetsp:Transcript_34240/g.46309  ORF Transcript_34240/g.46309 Transcript_34240/m.46309 type:complete len:107 (-) Transcript_34240:1917-2237(-)